MSKYFKNFEDLKINFVVNNPEKGEDDETITLFDNTEVASIHYSRRSRFGRNPETNIMEYEAHRHDHSDFEYFLMIIIGCSKK